MCSIKDSSLRRRYGLEISPPRLDEMGENICPIISAIPSDFAWRVDLHRHDLADGAALDKDDTRADTPILSTAIFTSLDISSHKRITTGDVCSRNDMSARNRERTTRIAVVGDTEFNKQSLLANVCRYTFQAKRLKTRPCK